MDERRQFIEDWGPYILSGIPMLFALYLALTFQPTRPFIVDPLVYVMALLAFTGLSFLTANLLGERSPRALKVLFGLATLVAMPGLLFKSVTQASAVQLAWISVAWGTIALVGKFRGFWWVQAPLERLSGVASRPEEWVQDWLEKYYEVNPFEIPAEEALQRAKLDWNAMLDGGEATSEGQAAAQSLMRSKPSLAARVKAFILDEDFEDDVERHEPAIPKMFAFIMPKVESEESPEPKLSAAELLRRFRFDYEDPEPEEDVEEQFEEQRMPWWKRLFADDEDDEDEVESERSLIKFFVKRRNQSEDREAEPEGDIERLRRLLREARR